MRSLISLAAAFALAAAPAVSAEPKVCAACVKANMAKLAGDELRGRACGTPDENAAARFVAAQLKASKVKGAGEGGAYLQPVQFKLPTYAAPPTLTVGATQLTQGREILTLDAAPLVEGPVALVALGDVDAASGRVAVYDSPYDPHAVALFFKAGAVAVVTQAPDQVIHAWDGLAARPPRGVQVLGVDAAPPPLPTHTMVFAKPEAIQALRAAEGQMARIAAPRGETALRTTYNVLGVIPGKGTDAGESILLTAHYDHLGVIAGQTYHGADDDASGTAAVLEFARMLGAGKAPNRTVEFALFGCEEAGGHGAKYFLAHPPTPLADIAANLEFEMIGNVDPRHPKSLMLTGWERSNLGPALASHGAAIGPDIDPDQHFFERSDNIQLARKGVVAQTVSAWPLPPTYHQPSDDLAHLDEDFMVRVIQSMAGPVDWLLNSDFKPEWNPGGQP